MSKGDEDSNDITLLRPGGISLQDISKCLGYEVRQAEKNVPRASGMLKSHYAPHVPTYLLDDLDELKYIARVEGERIAVMARAPKPTPILATVLQPQDHWHTLSENPEIFAKDLYAALRHCEAIADKIFIEAVPDEPAWLAVRDRLMRASALYLHELYSND